MEESANDRIQCQDCGRLFASISNRNRHRKPSCPSKRPRLLGPVPKEFICTKCERRYSHKPSLNRHKRSCPAITGVSTSRCGGAVPSAATVKLKKRRLNGAQCGLCGMSQLSRHDLVHHVHNVHGVQAALHTKTFDTVDDFESWMESNFPSVFYKRNLTLRDTATYHYYYCERSGAAKLKYGLRTEHEDADKERKRSVGRKWGETKKLGFTCTAYITLKESPDVIEAVYCPDHYGHSAVDTVTRKKRKDRIRSISHRRPVSQKKPIRSVPQKQPKEITDYVPQEEPNIRTDYVLQERPNIDWDPVLQKLSALRKQYNRFNIPQKKSKQYLPTTEILTDSAMDESNQPRILYRILEPSTGICMTPFEETKQLLGKLQDAVSGGDAEFTLADADHDTLNRYLRRCWHIVQNSVS